MTTRLVCKRTDEMIESRRRKLMNSIESNDRFDEAGKLDADDWLCLPRAQLKPTFALDAALAHEMAQLHFDFVRRMARLPVKVEDEPDGLRLRAPLGKTLLLLREAELIADGTRAETSWRIAGGFVLAHRVHYGGRFYIGAEWMDDGATLKLYVSIRRYPPRLISYFGVPRGVAVYQRTQGRAYHQIEQAYLRELARRLKAEA